MASPIKVIDLSDMVSTEPASFLNLDLELESHADLSALAEYMEKQVFVLDSHETERGFRLALEPVIDGALNGNPVQCAEHFIKLLHSLPADLAAIWNDCTSRVFDFGFDGGNEAAPYHTEISAALLEQIAKLGVEIRITIYPHREREPDEE